MSVILASLEGAAIPEQVGNMSLRRTASIVLGLTLPLLGLTAVQGAADAHQASVPAPTAGALPSAVPSAVTPQVDNGAVW